MKVENGVLRYIEDKKMMWYGQVKKALEMIHVQTGFRIGDLWEEEEEGALKCPRDMK